MKKTTKIAIGIGVTGITGIGIFTILKQRKLAKQAFDAEFDDFDDDDEIVENDVEDKLPEFTEYTGIPVDTVTAMLNSVTHKKDGYSYYIKSKDFEAIRESLGVFKIYIRNNYDYWSIEEKVCGEMITFRIHDGYCVSNDGFFLISGEWKYLSKDEVLDDYMRCAQCRERLYDTNECYII